MTVTIRITNWSRHKEPLKRIREQVFIREQQVPVELEWDEMDETAIHVLAEVLLCGEKTAEKKLAIGTARIIINNKQAHIGRMAVLSEWRGKGLGFEILLNCINECQKQGVEKIILNAQVYIIPFYQKSGFKISSNKFIDAGIAHKQMTLLLHPPVSSKKD